MLYLLLLDRLHFRIDDHRHTVYQARMMNTLGALRQAMWANSIPAVAHPTDLDDGLRVLAQRIHEDLQHRLEDYDPLATCISRSPSPNSRPRAVERG